MASFDSVISIHHCCYCECRVTILNFTYEHLIPRSKGGSGMKSNKQPCCKKCNGMRKDLPLTEFLNALETSLNNPCLKNKVRNRLETMILNVEHWINYTALHGAVLFKDNQHYQKHAAKYCISLQQWERRKAGLRELAA